MIDRELVGKTFGRYTVISQDDNPSEKRWWCRCECGALRSVYQHNLLSGNAKSCGCFASEQSSARRFMNRVGLRYGRLQVIEQATTSPKGSIMWKCRCDCGEERIVFADNLGNGSSQSCGCLHRDNLVARSTTHGMSDTGEFRSWSGMRSRCTLQTNENWDNYGGRGIRVCERWMDSFENFLADMGPRPTSKHTIERNNVNGDYEPGNCHWADRLEQTRNRRNTKTANYKGEEHHLADLAKLAKVSYRIFHGRLSRGWSIDEAVEGRPPIE